MATAKKKTNKIYNVCPKPEENTNFQLLIALVPDIEERLKKMKRYRPAFFKELWHRAVETENGWRPLHCWQGFD